jgi:hypothetical protein
MEKINFANTYEIITMVSAMNVIWDVLKESD